MSELKYKKQKYVKCTNIDPTVIIRLHSILADIDIFYLTQQDIYSIQHHSKLIYSMRLPADFRELVKKIKDINKIAVEWSNSHEVTLYGWTLEKTLQILEEVQLQSTQSERLYMNVGRV
jgi:hypothetical protein